MKKMKKKMNTKKTKCIKQKKIRQTNKQTKKMK